MLKSLLSSFDNIWEGGYFEGDCLDPLSPSTYGQIGYMSVLHATYLRCIKPYIDSNSICLEIGPGRGAWTKAMLNAKQIHVMDLLSAEHNKFYEYVGEHPSLTYHQVENTSCHSLPDNHFNYMFSFGCLCHMPYEYVEDYAKSLFPKLQSGCECFWMIADYEKFNASIKNVETNSIYRRIFNKSSKYYLLNSLLRVISMRQLPAKISDDLDSEPRPMRWFNSGITKTVKMLEENGYKVLDKDVGTCLRDPIIHFTKP